jgi:hypothetical protein
MRKWNWLLTLALAASGTVSACGTTATATDDAQVTADAQTDDIGADVANGSDVAADVAADVAPDAALSCPTPPTVELVQPPETCTETNGGKPYVDPTPPDVSRKKFAVSLFHFNIEYVIGGLEYIDLSCVSHVFTDNPQNVGWGNDKVEDFIVRESFLPILQMYDKHPTWGVDLELQAYMIDVMAARHPDVLNLLRKLAQRGQVEIISFHYNAQFFLGFPREDLHRSLAAVKAAFQKHCLPLSGVVFNQEGQAGEGRQKMLVDEGYTVGVHPKNLFYYVHQNTSNPWPYFASEGGDLIVGGAGVDPSSGIQLAWNFMDDGELAAAPEVSGQKLNPYFATTANHDPASLAKLEQERADTEKQGFYMTTIGDYVRHLKAEKIEEKTAPALLDGTWQPNSTDSVHRWLGGRGLWGADENDFEVRSGNYEARTLVSGVQVLAEVAQQAGKSAANQDARLAKLWKDLWRVEVSDCSGVNPWLAEVQWALDHNPQIMLDAQQLATELKAALGYKYSAHVDIAARTSVDQPLPFLPALPEVDPPADMTATKVEVDGRTVTVKWYKLGEKIWRMRIDFGAASADNDPFGRELKVTFPRFTDVIAYSPGLLDDVVRSYPFSAFEFQQDHVWLPVPNGLIGLGNGWYVVKHARLENLAARVNVKAPEIAFSDETVRLALAPTWQFEVLQGTAEDALAVAKHLNVAPTVDF